MHCKLCYGSYCRTYPNFLLPSLWNWRLCLSLILIHTILLHKWRELSTTGNCLEFYFHWRKLLMLWQGKGKCNGHIFLRFYNTFVPILCQKKSNFLLCHVHCLLPHHLYWYLRTIYFVGGLVPEYRLQTAHFTFSLGTRPRSYIVSMLSWLSAS